MATCYAVRDQVIDRFIRTQEKHSEAKEKIATPGAPAAPALETSDSARLLAIP